MEVCGVKPIATKPAVPESLARQLVLDELFDLSLYRRLAPRCRGGMKALIESLIPIETHHFEFWREFFGMKLDRLDWPRRMKLALLAFICRLFGDRAISLVLEVIELHGIRKYLLVWRAYEHDPLGKAVRDILEDEFRHEDAAISEGVEKKIDAEGIRDIFLGFNDGLVEMLGAASGFFAAFTDVGSTLIAGLTVAVAGALSMAAGAYVAASSGNEVREMELSKSAFLRAAPDPAEAGGPEAPLRSGIVVGASYFVGAVLPLLPIALGARTILWPIVVGAILLILLSMILAFLSGMDVRKRIVMNLIIMAFAVTITYTLGLLVKRL